MTNQRSQQSLDLSRLLSGAQLPALPQSAIRVMELSKDPDNGPAEFAIPIESEPGLASQVLRFVNSSYFGFSREISSVKLAITLVGIRTIKNFVLWSAVYNLIPNTRCSVLDLKKLWQDSLRRGLFARTLGKGLGLKDTEEPFAAALLQDMAIPLLAKELPEQYSELLEKRARTGERLSDLEREMFGWTHADAARVIAGHWNLPPGFAVLMERHILIDSISEDASVNPDHVAVTLSALLPSAIDETWAERARFEELYGQVCAGAPPIRDVLEQVDEQFEDFAPTLRLPVTSRPLVAYYDELPTTVA
ncbi:MAG: HDOD domain-containing protein [Pirellulales bacterium]